MILDYLKNVGITITGMLISIFLVTLLNYFNIIVNTFFHFSIKNCVIFSILILQSILVLQI